MSELAFTPFPKISRLQKDMVVTEKIDGTNAAIGVTEDGVVYAQSRKQLITPEKDNAGFAAWVAAHEDALREGLGPGVHFGEWWGSGIQRGYGLPQGEKRFSLFNTGRWYSWFNTVSLEYATHYSDRLFYADDNGIDDEQLHRCDECPVCYVVPVLLTYTFDTGLVVELFDGLKDEGSVAAPGFDNPEGVVVFHTAQGTLFKLSDAKVPPPEYDRSAGML